MARTGITSNLTELQHRKLDILADDHGLSKSGFLASQVDECWTRFYGEAHPGVVDFQSKRQRNRCVRRTDGGYTKRPA